jgi:hypothetical protein
MQIKAGTEPRTNSLFRDRFGQLTMTDASWHPISTAPFDCDLELAVLEGNDTHALVFRCQRTPVGWINAATGQRINVDPTHWRNWRTASS